MKKLLKRLEERREVLKDRHEHLIELANKYEEECVFDEMEWYRSRAMEINARIYELDYIIDWVRREI